MNHIQTILQGAISRIVEGSTVAGINEVSANNYTFTTTDLKNIRVGLSVIIGAVKFRVTAIDTKTKTVSVYGFSLPDGSTWQLALYFRYGSRVEVNALLKDEVSVRKEAFPFIWLILNFQQTPQPQIGTNAYSTEIKLFFVNSSEEKIVAKDRLAQNFEKVFDNITELFFAELNSLPTAANFARKVNEPINGKLTDRYFFGSQENNSNVIAVNQTDAREYDIPLTVLNSACLGSNSNFLPVLVPTFSLIDNGTDVEAFTDQLFTIRKTLKNTTNDLRPVPYSITFDWGILGTETFEGILQFGESVNLVSAKVLTGISGAYTINILGSVTDSVVISVIEPLPAEYLEFIIDTSVGDKSETISTLFTSTNDFKIRWSDTLPFTNCNHGNNTYTYTDNALNRIIIYSQTNNWNNLYTLALNVFQATRKYTSVNIDRFSRQSPTYGEIQMFNCQISSLIMPSNTKLAGLRMPYNNIDSLNLSGITSSMVPSIINNNSLLTTVNLNFSGQLTRFVDFTNCALLQSEVDKILKSCVDSNVNSPGSYCRLIGGTNATPSATGLTYKATLISRGWTVTHN